MKKKVVFIGIPLLLSLGLFLFFFLRLESARTILEGIPLTPQTRAKAARLKLHPLSNEAARQATLKQPVATWDEWVEQQTEIGLGVAVEYLPYLNTPEAIVQMNGRRFGRHGHRLQPPSNCVGPSHHPPRRWTT